MSLAKQHIIKRLSLDVSQQYPSIKSSKCENLNFYQQPIQLKDKLSQDEQSEQQYRKLEKKLRLQFTGTKKNNPQRNSLDQKYFFEKDDTMEKIYTSQDYRQENFNIVDYPNYLIQKSCCCNHQQSLQLQQLNSEISDRDKTIKNLQEQIIGLKVKLASFNDQKQINSILNKKNIQLEGKCKLLEDKEKANSKQIQTLKIQNKRMMENKELSQYLASKCISLKGYDASSISGLSNYFEDQAEKEQQELLTIEEFNLVNSNTQLSNNYTQFSERKCIQKQKTPNLKRFDKQTIKQSAKKPIVPKAPASKVDSKTRSQNGCKNAKKLNEADRLKVSLNGKNVGSKKEQEKSDITEKKIENNTIELQNLRMQIKQLRKQVTEKSSQVTQKDGQIQELESRIKQIKQHFTTNMAEKEEQKRTLKRKNIILKEYVKKLTTDNQKVLTLYKKNCMEHFQNFFQQKKQKYENKFMNIISMLKKHYLDEIKRQRNYQARKQRSQRISIQKIMNFINQDQGSFNHKQFKDFQFTVEIDQTIRNSILKAQTGTQTILQEQNKSHCAKIFEFQTPEHKQIFRKIPQQNLSTLEKSFKDTLKKQSKTLDMVDQQSQATQAKLLMIVQRNLQLSINPKLSTFKSNIQTQILIQKNIFIHQECQTQCLQVNKATQCYQIQLNHIDSQTSPYLIEKDIQTSICQRTHKSIQIGVQSNDKQIQMQISMVNQQQTTDFFHNKINLQSQCEPIYMLQNQCQSFEKISKLIYTDSISMANAETNTVIKTKQYTQTIRTLCQIAQIQTESYQMKEKLVGSDHFQSIASTQTQKTSKISKQLNTDSYLRQAGIQVKASVQKNCMETNTNQLRSTSAQTSKRIVQTVNDCSITDQISKEAYTQSNFTQKIDFSIQVAAQNILRQSIAAKNKETFTQTIQQTICSTQKQQSLNQALLIKMKKNSFSQVPTQAFINQRYQSKQKTQQKQYFLSEEQPSTLKLLLKQEQLTIPINIQKEHKQQQFNAIFHVNDNDTISEIDSCLGSCILGQQPLNKSIIRKTHFQNHQTNLRKQNISNDPNMTRNNDKSKQIFVELTTQQYKNLPIEIVLQKVFKSIPQGFERQEKLQYIDKKFKWKPQKYYYLQTVSDCHHLEKFLLWKKGILSLNSGKFLRLKPKGLIPENKQMLILGNSQVTASGNELKVRLKKRNQLIGNLENGTWKVLNCQIFFPKVHQFS